jgi:hypothetical protein
MEEKKGDLPDKVGRYYQGSFQSSKLKEEDVKEYSWEGGMCWCRLALFCGGAAVPFCVDFVLV